MKKIKKIVLVIIGVVIGVSTTVGAATIFNSKDITYSSSTTSKTNVKDSLDELYGKASQVGNCPEGYECYKPLAAQVELGDYIRMTPTSTSYTISKNLTGYTSDQTINPSELNLWRVIRKNDDGTVDAVSEYVSSIDVYFKGKTGYMNFVGALNIIAAQYTNEKYVERTRYMGYGNQTEFCTSNIGYCKQDIGYETDIGLVQSVIGTLKGTTSSGNNTKYWVSSRKYDATDDGEESQYYGRIITQNGDLSTHSLYDIYDYNKEEDWTSYGKLRIILKMKSNLEIASGDGMSANTAYQLS